MKRLTIFILLITFPSIVFAQYKMTEYPRDTGMTDDDIVSGANSPASSPTNAAYTLGALKTYINAGVSTVTNWSDLEGLKAAVNWADESRYLSTNALDWQGLEQVQRADINWLDANIFVNGTNVGIGTPDTTALFHLSSTASANLLQIDDDGTGDASPVVITSAGYLGIGTTNPIAGNINWIANVYRNTNANTALAVVNVDTGSSAQTRVEVKSADSNGYLGNVPTTFSSAPFAGRTIVYNESGNGLLLATGNSADSIAFRSGSNASMSILAGNVGITTITPQALLDITSTAAQNLFVINDNGSGDTTPFVVNSDGNVGIGSPNPQSKVSINGSGTTTGASLTIRDSAGTLLTTQLDNGNLGIEASSPVALLDISSTKAQDLFIVNDNGAGDPSPFVITSTGNIGVGTIIPVEWKIKVVDSTAAQASFVNTSSSGSGVTSIVRIGVDDGAAISSGDGLGEIYLSGASTSSHNFLNGATIRAIATEDWGASNAGTRLTFRTVSNGSTGATDRMTIGPSGNVGIGTLTPQQRFCVGSTCQGSIDSSGNIIGVGFTSNGNVGITTTAPVSCGCKQYTNGLCTTVGTCA
jgi:hypothetical protein